MADASCFPTITCAQSKDFAASYWVMKPVTQTLYLDLRTRPRITNICDHLVPLGCRLISSSVFFSLPSVAAATDPAIHGVGMDCTMAGLGSTLMPQHSATLATLFRLATTIEWSCVSRVPHRVDSKAWHMWNPRQVFDSVACNASY